MDTQVRQRRGKEVGAVTGRKHVFVVDVLERGSHRHALVVTQAQLLHDRVGHESGCQHGQVARNRPPVGERHAVRRDLGDGDTDVEGHTEQHQSAQCGMAGTGDQETRGHRVTLEDHHGALTGQTTGHVAGHLEPRRTRAHDTDPDRACTTQEGQPTGQGGQFLHRLDTNDAFTDRHPACLRHAADVERCDVVAAPPTIVDLDTLRVAIHGDDPALEMAHASVGGQPRDVDRAGVGRQVPGRHGGGRPAVAEGRWRHQRQSMPARRSRGAFRSSCRCA